MMASSPQLQWNPYLVRGKKTDLQKKKCHYLMHGPPFRNPIFLTVLLMISCNVTPVIKLKSDPNVR